jgi:hypothetical protein
MTISLTSAAPRLWRVLTAADAVLDEANRLAREGVEDRRTTKELADAHHRLLREAASTLNDELLEELHRLVLPFENHELSAVEAAFAHAQLVGWLTGLVEGVRTGLISIHERDEE